MIASLIIKGDGRVAQIELASRGITVRPCEPLRETAHGETVALVDCELGQLQRWFGEVYGRPAPFSNACTLAPGELLLFTPFAKAAA